MTIMHRDIGPGATHIDGLECACGPIEAVTVRTSAGDVHGELIERAPFCVAVRYAGSIRPDGDWFDARTGARRGDPSAVVAELAAAASPLPPPSAAPSRPGSEHPVADAATRPAAPAIQASHESAQEEIAASSSTPR